MRPDDRLVLKSTCFRTRTAWSQLKSEKFNGRKPKKVLIKNSSLVTMQCNVLSVSPLWRDELLCELVTSLAWRLWCDELKIQLVTL